MRSHVTQPPIDPLQDRLHRPLGSLRISVTDRCNMRCRYCMPEESYTWLPRASLLTFEEVDRLAGLFVRLGVQKVRLTGGEPLLRHGLVTLISQLAKRVPDVALTTNGILLAEEARALRTAGLGRVTVSLDTLHPERMAQFARSTSHADVLLGITGAREVGFPVKLNTVVIRGYNDDELSPLLAFGARHDVEVRFIEYMDVGGATQWASEDVVSRDEMLKRLQCEPGGGEVRRLPRQNMASPAEQFALPSGQLFGIVSSTTAPFCGTCDRGRLTADGTWYRCLYAEEGIDLREPLRGGASDAELCTIITEAWRDRDDQGAVERLASHRREALYQVKRLREDPRLEMHTRGG